MIYSPLEQFEIKPLLLFNNNITLSITNYVIYIIIVSLIIYNIKSILNNSKLSWNRWGVSILAIYDTILNLIKNQIGVKGGYYFPLIFTIFIIIFLCNLISMIPYSFAITTQLVLILSFSFTLWLGVTILGLARHKLKYFNLFVPSGTPLVLVPMLVMIEILSNSSRALSLGLRLSANILSGHLLMIILGLLTLLLMSSSIFGFIFGFIPIIIIIAIVILEFAIGIIQAYVFSILLASYLKDSIDLH